MQDATGPPPLSHLHFFCFSRCPPPPSCPQNDGLSLLTATLRHWVAKGEDCPNVLVSTHFHSLMHRDLLQRSPLVEYLVRGWGGRVGDVSGLAVHAVYLYACFVIPCMRVSVHV